MQNEYGFVSLKTVTTILVLMLAVYIGFKIIPPWIDYFSFQDEVKQVLKYSKVQSLTEKEIKQSILRKARELHIPITERDIYLQRHGDQLKLTMDYEVRIFLPLGLERAFPFSIEVQS